MTSLFRRLLASSGFSILPKEEYRRLKQGLNDLQTQLKKAEERYHDEKTKVETLVHNIPDGIVIANLRGDVLYINAPAMAMLGVRSEEVTQSEKGLFEMIRQDRLRTSVQKILERHTHSETIELPGEGTRGARFFQTTVTLFSLPEQRDFGVLVMMRDVTTDRQLSQMKDEFFHSVAHDLRAPLFAIQGYLRLLEKAVSMDTRVRGYFDAVYQSCEKLTLFIQDILDTYRLEAGQLKLNVSSLEPLAFLQRIKTLYGPVAEEKGIRLEVQLPDDYPGAVEGDERLLERVFHNLISNALKFTPRGGEVRISVTRAGQDLVEFSVSDTGPGIPAELRMSVFEKFGQGPGQDRSGFGLGLHICRRIVELHGGQIWVETGRTPPGSGLPARGSEFVFRIPQKQASVAV